MNDKVFPQGLGFFLDGSKSFLYYRDLSSSGFQIETGFDGFNFSLQSGLSAIINQKKQENINLCSDFRISKVNAKNYFLTYKRKTGKIVSSNGAISEDLFYWKTTGSLPSKEETSMLVPQYQCEGKYVLCLGGKNIKIAFSEDLKIWKIENEGVLLPQKDRVSLEIGTLMATQSGITLIYYETEEKDGISRHAIKMALFDKENPSRILRQYDENIWEQPSDWHDKKVHPLGIISLKNQLISYWEIENEGIFAIAHSLLAPKGLKKISYSSPSLKKSEKNPLLKPVVENFWESQAVFNPAAIYEKGKVHILYRAVGDKGISVLGYASSKDGLHIDERLNEPAYIPREPFESNLQASHVFHAAYMSGGGSGGCEDPRVTRIGDKLYMTYVAFDGNGPPRVALTSISVEDFISHRWTWARPVLISAPNVVDKNACILPEKIGGKYVIFHRVFPDILIDFVDSLDFDGQTWLKGEYRIKTRDKFWDSRKIGVGPPPIKTKIGWLVIYQAVTDCGHYHYKMGAMILDLKNPTRVLYRCAAPILEATEHYEMQGYKPGVIYPCGAVVIDDQLFVYYGGADEVICVATAKLNDFLHHLQNSESAQLTPVVTQYLSSASN